MRRSSRRKTRLVLTLLLTLGTSLALSGCEVDPDIDVSRPPVVPKPDTDDGDTDSGDTDTDPGDTDPGDTDPGDTDPGDTDPGDTNPPDGGGACFGHCDCGPNEYCALIGTCQLQVVGGGHYCCSRLDDCPEGESCHVEGTVEEYDVCPAPL